MVFTVDNFKVTMTAKTSIQGCYGLYEDPKNSSEKAMAFMNKIALLAFKAAQSYERENDYISANNARKIAHQIVEQIDKTGYYRI